MKLDYNPSELMIRHCARIAIDIASRYHEDPDKACADFLDLFRKFDASRAREIDDLYNQLMDMISLRPAGRELQITHIDGDPLNNSPTNLRLVDPRENRR